MLFTWKKNFETCKTKRKGTFRRCKLVVGGSAIALKILAEEGFSEAILCNTLSLSIQGCFSSKKELGATKSNRSASRTMMMRRSTAGLVQQEEEEGDEWQGDWERSEQWLEWGSSVRVKRKPLVKIKMAMMWRNIIRTVHFPNLHHPHIVTFPFDAVGLGIKSKLEEWKTVMVRDTVKWKREATAVAGGSSG